VTEAGILVTKLHIPVIATDAVVRPRLTTKLNLSLKHRLTLVIAPAGFGKTTLLAAWAQAAPCPVGWLSLDEQDDSWQRFMRYLIHAFRSITPNFGIDILALLDSLHRPQPETLMTQMANEMAFIQESCVVILDDFHVLDDLSIYHTLEFLLTHLPPQVHFIIASRTEPAFNLPLLRGRGQLLELNSADLRFTAIEVEQFLTDVMHLQLTASDRVTLEMRTEGWVTGLQLAALSLQSQPDPSSFLAAFTGTHRYIADFLFEEVLRHQSAEIQRFLLYTSIVDRMSGELCDVLLETRNGQATLESIEAAGLFVMPLDSTRQWYRYHQLFAEMLRLYLRRVYPDQVQRLHEKASRWYEQEHRLEEAIRHGLAAQDYERSALLIETAFQQRDWIHHDMHHLLIWFEALPGEVAGSRPKLILAYAWLLLELFSNRWEQIETLLRQVEHLLAASASNMAYEDEEIALMLAQVDLLRANRARHEGQDEQVIALCQQALVHLPENETYIRSGTLAHLAAAYESMGNVAEASRLFSDSLQMCRSSGNVDGFLFATGRLIHVFSLSGQLRQAERVFDQSVTYAAARTGPDMGAVYISMGEIFREQNQLEQAASLLKQGITRCHPFEAWRTALMTGLMTSAQILAAEGHLDEAVDRLLDIEKQYPFASPLEKARLESVRTRLQLQQGNFQAAAQWAMNSGLSAIADPDYTHEFDLLTFIRVLLTQAALDEQGMRVERLSAAPLQDADRLLHKLYQAAHSGGRMGRVIEIYMLQALAHAVDSDMTAALKWLQEALALAEPEGYVRVFVDEGLPMYRLLMLLRTRPVSSSISDDYLNALRDAFPRSVRQLAAELSPSGTALTEGELNTLRLLASDRSIEEIAAELSVAVSTVRTYTKRIYSKLDAHSRAEAIYRARELNLV
jgi:LuxR family maltose regulon positive regulatory protein